MSLMILIIEKLSHMAFDITYVEPDETESVNDIIWHNLREADKHHHLLSFIYAANAWLRENKSKDYSDFEKEIRINNLNTHLIACVPRITRPDMKLGILGRDDRDYKYECIYSCRPKKYALEELLENSSSYEENFEKLKQSGSIMLDDSLNEGIDLHVLSKREKTDGELVEECKKKIYYKTTPAEKVIEQLINSCRERFGKEPDRTVYGIDSEGPVYGFVIDGRLISDIGYKYNTKVDKNSNETMSIIKLR